MSNTFRYGLSPVMVARWGLESLADVYIHDNEKYSYQLLNSIFITFHPDDPARMRSALEKTIATGSDNSPPSAPAIPQYLAVLGTFILIMCAGITLALVGKERKSHAS
jgi:hypothetical protein